MQAKKKYPSKKQLREMQFMNRSLEDYRDGDPESYDLLLKSLEGVRIGSKIDSTDVWRILPSFMNVFMRLNPGLLPSKDPSATFWGHGGLVRVALQTAAQKYGYGQRGYGRVTTYVSALIASMDPYFHRATRYGKESAFRAFRENVATSDKLRNILIHYNTQDVQDRGNMLRLLRNVEKLKYDELVFRAPALMHFVHLHRHFCGNAKAAQEELILRRLKGYLKRSGSMQEFLTKFLGKT